MSSRCRRNRALGRLARLAFAAPALGLAGCYNDSRNAAAPPAAEGAPHHVAVSALFPGEGQAPPQNPVGLTYINDPQAIAEGKRLFGWYNCSGCHFHGAGGMGPSLMDSEWIYGGQIDQIFASIYQGRPNGMPVWGGIIPVGDIWKIAAYVHSLPAEGAKIPIPTEPPPAVVAPTKSPEPSPEAPTGPGESGRSATPARSP